MLINTPLNRIHEWGDPIQHPLKRLFLTRLEGITTSALEVLDLANTLFECAEQLAHTSQVLACRSLYVIFPKSQRIYKIAKQPSDPKNIFDTLLKIGKLVIGIISSITLGIFISPELNFRFHLWMRLIDNNLNMRTQKLLQAKLSAELEAIKISQQRAERFAQFQENQQKEWA